ncbi:flagellar basal body-associated FliL family protein [Asaia astilbis]|uniref:flagellar basal body-associated FliL family protein n=1 Tax=Asaia astilbis TaxID=610244 RepID=UPI000A6F2A6B|nr:flagellar basal body-associated FliL family protein [Asaia astilbis]
MSESRFGDDLDVNPVDDDRLGLAALPRKKKRLLLIVGILVLALLGGGAYFAIEKGWIFGHKKAQTASQTGDAPPGETSFLTIPAIISSLDNGDGRPVYVKMTTKIEVAGKVSEPELRGYIPAIQDIFQTYLHETRPQEIRGNGIYRLRETLLRRLRIQIAPLKVTNFYITEFLIQ